jgi:hypothetical protein
VGGLSRSEVAQLAADVSGPGFAVIVAIDHRGDLRRMPAACEFAQSTHARIEIVCGIPRVWPWVGLVTSQAALEEDVLNAQRMLLVEALSQVPPDLPVTHRIVAGRASRWIRRAHSSQEHGGQALFRARGTSNPDGPAALGEPGRDLT